MIQLVPGGFIKAVEDDSSPALGGDLDGQSAHSLVNMVGGEFTSIVVNTTTLVVNAEGYEGRVGIGKGSPPTCLSVYQDADGLGFRLYGYDDKDDQYLSIALNSAGTARISGTRSKLFIDIEVDVTSNKLMITGASPQLVTENATGAGLNLRTGGGGASFFGFIGGPWAVRNIHGGNPDDDIIHVDDGSPSSMLYLKDIGTVGIGLTGPTGQLHILQAEADGARPVLRLDQKDIDDSFIDLIGQTAEDGSRSISSDTTEDSAKFGAYKIEINGVTKWIRIYDDHS